MTFRYRYRKQIIIGIIATIIIIGLVVFTIISINKSNDKEDIVVENN